jgi:hypothetical protein
MTDNRLHEQLVAAEIEDCALLHREVSTYLEFWGIARRERALPPPLPAPDAAPGLSAAR